MMAFPVVNALSIASLLLFFVVHYYFLYNLCNNFRMQCSSSLGEYVERMLQNLLERQFQK